VKSNRLPLFFTLAAVMLLSSCSKLGWGVLLWSIDDPPVLSGSVLPVYIKSNIDRVWVVGVPETSRIGSADRKVEIPLSQFEFAGSKRKAEKRAQEFAQYALMYAENLQDGLPIRDAPDNSSKRVYRLRLGEIIKILDVAQGNPPISATGDPLQGEWYKVLTHDGVTGYCFSYRLKVYEHNDAPLQAAAAQREKTADPDLEIVLSRTWSPESYQQMVNSRRIKVQELEKHYRFDPGQDTGTARIILPDMEREFRYDGIYSNGERSWRFEGANLQMTLRQNNTLAVQFNEGSGSRRTLLFVTLSTDVNDIIAQENARREGQFLTIYNQGPVFTSNNYGTITFMRTGDFTWSGYNLLVPQFIPSETKGTGRVYMDLYISSSFEERFNGAFTLRFTDIRQNNTICFLYGLDNQGLRLEVVPEFGIEDTTVTRRASPPTVLYFFRDSPL